MMSSKDIRIVLLLHTSIRPAPPLATIGATDVTSPVTGSVAVTTSTVTVAFGGPGTGSRMPLAAIVQNIREVFFEPAVLVMKFPPESWFTPRTRTWYECSSWKPKTGLPEASNVKSGRKIRRLGLPAASVNVPAGDLPVPMSVIWKVFLVTVARLMGWLKSSVIDSLTATWFRPQLIWVPPTPPPQESEHETICREPPDDPELVEEPPEQADRIIPSPRAKPERSPGRGDLAVCTVDAGVIRVAIETGRERNETRALGDTLGGR